MSAENSIFSRGYNESLQVIARGKSISAQIKAGAIGLSNLLWDRKNIRPAFGKSSDYHLLKGGYSTDLVLRPRSQGARYDIGGYEFYKARSQPGSALGSILNQGLSIITSLSSNFSTLSAM